jgi:hypothetical protein
MPLIETPDGDLVPVEIDLTPLAEPVDVFGDTAEIDLGKIPSDTATYGDGSLKVEAPSSIALPLSESHSEMLELLKQLRPVLLVHGSSMRIGERLNKLLDDIDRAIRKAEAMR